MSATLDLQHTILRGVKKNFVKNFFKVVKQWSKMMASWKMVCMQPMVWWDFFTRRFLLLRTAGKFCFRKLFGVEKVCMSLFQNFLFLKLKKVMQYMGNICYKQKLLLEKTYPKPFTAISEHSWRHYQNLKSR